jgi:hypothetical protein
MGGCQRRLGYVVRGAHAGSLARQPLPRFPKLSRVHTENIANLEGRSLVSDFASPESGGRIVLVPLETRVTRRTFAPFSVFLGSRINAGPLDLNRADAYPMAPKFAHRPL